MGKHRTDDIPVRTIWEIPDDVWAMIQTMLAEHYPAKGKGHRWVSLRGVLHGLIFRLRTGGDLVERNPTDRGKNG